MYMFVRVYIHICIYVYTYIYIYMWQLPFCIMVQLLFFNWISECWWGLLVTVRLVCNLGWTGFTSGVPKCNLCWTGFTSGVSKCNMCWTGFTSDVSKYHVGWTGFIFCHRIPSKISSGPSGHDHAFHTLSQKRGYVKCSK